MNKTLSYSIIERINIYPAGHGAAAQSVSVKSNGCGFDPLEEVKCLSTQCIQNWRKVGIGVS